MSWLIFKTFQFEMIYFCNNNVDYYYIIIVIIIIIIVIIIFIIIIIVIIMILCAMALQFKSRNLSRVPPKDQENRDPA